MNKFRELQYNVDAMEHVVTYYVTFFAPISAYVKKLKSITDLKNVEEVSQSEIIFLAKKIEAFFATYRPSEDDLYLSPPEASNNDETAIEILKQASELNKIPESEFLKLLPSNLNASQSENILMVNKNIDKSKVFIVHGHEEQAKQEMARLITDLGFEPIILHEQATGGRTVIEKIEEYSNVGFAVVLYTPCDKGGKNSEPIDLKLRARQNVVFEHGYLIGKLGRDNVCALVRGSVETPNDISGVVYVPIDPHGAWKYVLASEMSNSGYCVDKNKIKA